MIPIILFIVELNLCLFFQIEDWLKYYSHCGLAVVTKLITFAVVHISCAATHQVVAELFGCAHAHTLLIIWICSSIGSLEVLVQNL